MGLLFCTFTKLIAQYIQYWDVLCNNRYKKNKNNNALTHTLAVSVKNKNDIRKENISMCLVIPFINNGNDSLWAK